MEQKNIDQLIKEKMEKGGGAIPSKPQWELIASKINVQPPATKKKALWIPWAIAAAVIAIMFVGVNALWTTKSDSLLDQNNVVIKEVDQSQTDLDVLNETDTETNEDILPHQSQKDPYPNTLATTSEYNKSKQTNQGNKATPIIDNKAIVTEKTVTTNQKSVEEKESKTEATSEWVDIPSSPTKENPAEWHFANTDQDLNLVKKQFSLGFSGAVNYGNQNSGYVLALSARQDLSSKVFIDGSVSMIYNNSSNQVIGLPSSLQNVTMSAAPVKSAMAREAVTYMPSVNTLYIQFNPVVGYRVVDDISISAGPDIQKLMNQNNNNNSFNYYTFKTDGTIAQLPDVDLGLTAQTEVNLSPNLKAGLLYRQGFNHLIAPSNINVINRNYFQFQFKYSFGVNSKK